MAKVYRSGFHGTIQEIIDTTCCCCSLGGRTQPLYASSGCQQLLPSPWRLTMGREVMDQVTNLLAVTDVRVRLWCVVVGREVSCVTGAEVQTARGFRDSFLLSWGECTDESCVSVCSTANIEILFVNLHINYSKRHNVQISALVKEAHKTMSRFGENLYPSVVLTVHFLPNYCIYSVSTAHCKLTEGGQGD